MTYSHVWHDSFICVTWLLQMCDATPSYEWHDSFICVTWLLHMCDATRSYVWHDSFICVTWLLDTSFTGDASFPPPSTHRQYENLRNIGTNSNRAKFSHWICTTRYCLSFPICCISEVQHVQRYRGCSMFRDIRYTGRRRPIRCLKLQLNFRKRATNYRALLRKIAYNDKATYESSPPCTGVTSLISHVCYGVATISRINKIIGLFCRIASLLWGSFAKETYTFIDATNISQIIWLMHVCAMTSS